MRFAKGHGTENDFVILPDPEGGLDLTASQVAALCDRRAGIGGDGVLRVVRTKALGESLPPGAESAEGCEWFMDYRNADGSIAEMCGNGVRVFARYLVATGLVAAGVFEVGTRAGARRVTVEDDGEITVDMGPVRFLGEGGAVLADGPVRGSRISVGNPHLACAVSRPVAEVDLGRAPVLDREAFPDGANVEVYRVLEPGTLEMRVYERGSAETRSCGTGIVAAAAAADAAAGAGAPAVWRVRVPGGECVVTLDAGDARLRGPAVIVAEGDVHLAK
ncbi:diaminopimelate epimerase [Marinitenerispora sediminis]|uniref:Diaminopimelate epimerase n=1 Tax=Marinitenerispora sediminis TaxID=1931232 RepID=A0A368T5I1_9ACTN|nr:diaminopimelate epimerase [Marinitenerispora sediminis]RCV50069.1 diaminopimelate epimerase [Marinitenerispora sediminis]RCV54004.1 diaminopimelate epimerase [Marinitenerispora sediminis]RCV58778.1 diaminopimelate epimerase [Marinitenerispora sediminis]